MSESSTDGYAGSDGPDGFSRGEGEELLDAVRVWLGRFIVTMRPADLNVLTLWAAHTHLARECYSTPRLLLDSAAPGAGKTTVLDHFEKLCAGACLMGTVASPATLVRLIHEGGEKTTTTVLLDEVDRNLRADRPGSEDLLAILNSGYRRGAVRPVNVPDRSNGWKVERMSTFAPVVLAGNSPRLPDDTRSRTITVVMVPATDADGIESSDWEDIETEAMNLGTRLAAWADGVRAQVSGIKAPGWLKNRDRERWLPLIRTGTVAGGGWDKVALDLAGADLERQRHDREHEVVTKAPAVQVLHDIAEVWPDGKPFLRTDDLLTSLAAKYPDRWGSQHERGGLTAQRLGRMLAPKHDIRSGKRYEHGAEDRGYFRSDFSRAFRRWGVGSEPSEPSEASEPSLVLIEVPDDEDVWLCSVCGAEWVDHLGPDWRGHTCTQLAREAHAAQEATA